MSLIHKIQRTIISSISEPKNDTISEFQHDHEK